MYFNDEGSLREMERMMRRIPNFNPRGHGVVILRSGEYRTAVQERIISGTATRREILTETTSSIRCPPFLQRLEQSIRKSEEESMDFKNDKHKSVFSEATAKLDRKNEALMAALYLMTADLKLWNAVRRCVQKNEIRFQDIHLNGSTERGYTLYCAAKDLYLGTNNLTISDLADTQLIPPRIFGLICNAMAIRRFGLGAVHFKVSGNQKSGRMQTVVSPPDRS